MVLIPVLVKIEIKELESSNPEVIFSPLDYKEHHGASKGSTRILSCSWTKGKTDSCVVIPYLGITPTKGYYLLNVLRHFIYSTAFMERMTLNIVNGGSMTMQYQLRADDGTAVNGWFRVWLAGQKVEDRDTPQAEAIAK